MRPLRRTFVVLTLPVLLAFASAAAARGSSCEPLSARDWAEKCRTREGRAEIERLVGSCRDWRSLRNVDSVDDACEILRLGDDAGTCERARRQALAFALNRAAGRISRDCCLERGEREVRLDDLARRHDDGCDTGRDCEGARAFFARLNDAARVGDCDGHGGGGHDDDDDDGHHGDDHSGCTNPAHARGHGNGHDCDKPGRRVGHGEHGGAGKGHGKGKKK